MHFVLSFFQLFLKISITAYGYADCNSVISSLGGPDDAFCVISEINIPNFKQCLKFVRDEIHRSDWYQYCDTTQLDFYKKDKDSYKKIIKVRAYDGPKNRGMFAISPDEWTLFNKDPILYANCVELKGHLDKDAYFNQCYNRDLSAYSNHYDAYKSCILGAEKIDHRFSPKDEFDCANTSILEFFERDQTVIDYCYKWMSASYSNVNLKSCLQLNLDLLRTYPNTYIHCLQEISNGNVEMCQSEKMYTVDIERCFTIFKDVNSDSRGICADFKRGGPVASESISFVINNEAKVRACIETVLPIFSRDHVTGDICGESDFIRKIVDHKAPIESCLKKSVTFRFDIKMCFSNIFIDSAEATSGAEEYIFNCYQQYGVKTTSEQTKMHALCHSTFGARCAKENPSFWASFRNFFENYPGGERLFPRISIALDISDISCPPIGHESNWFSCIDQYHLALENSSSGYRSKHMKNAGLACSDCIGGVRELVDFDSSKYLERSGLAICQKLAEDVQFSGLSKDQICFALANRKGFRRDVSRGWMIAEQVSDSLVKMGSLFGGMQMIGPTCPQYIFPLPSDGEINDESVEEIAPNEDQAQSQTITQ